MKLTVNHKKILSLSLVFLFTGIFMGAIDVKDYRSISLETETEIDLLTLRKNMVSDRQYYEENLENPDEEYVYMDSGELYISIGNEFSSYGDDKGSDKIYVSNTADVERVMKESGVENLDVLKIDKDYKTRLPIENPNVLGKENFLEEKADTVIVFVRKNEIVKYIHIDSRIVDFSKLERDKAYIGYGGFRIKLDDNYRLYADKFGV